MLVVNMYYIIWTPPTNLGANHPVQLIQALYALIPLLDEKELFGSEACSWPIM